MRLIITLLFLASNCCLYAQQNPHPYFRNYNTQDGLPSPEVYCVFEDSKGDMWFGTDNGATRFDGYEFHNYGPEQGLARNVVFDILEDSKNRIWFGTMEGEVFILENDKIRPYQYNHIIKSYRKRSHEIKLHYSDKSSTVFLKIKEYGVLSIDSLGNETLHTSESPIAHFVFSNPDLENSIDVNISRKKDASYSEKFIELNSSKLFPIDILREGKRIKKNIAAINRYQLRVHQKKGEQDGYLIFGEELNYLKDNSIAWTVPNENQPVKIVEQENGNIWICQINGHGLKRYKDINSLRENKYDIYLLGESISDCLIDKRGGIWATSIGKGIFYCANPQVLVYNSDFGLSEDFVSTATIKNENELFVGCSNGDIFHLDFSNEKIINQINSPDGHDNFDLFYHKPSNKLWRGNQYFTQSKWDTLQRIAPKFKRKFKSILACKRMNYHPSTNHLYGCGAKGFFVINLSDESIISNSSMSSMRIFSTFEDKEGQIWIGSADGLFEFKDDQFIRPSIENTFLTRRIEDIEALPNGTLVLGTKGGGVILWNKKTNELTQITDEDGLTSDMIEDVHLDERGNLWVGTLNGLNKISFYENNACTIRQFNISNGLPSKEVYQIKSFKEHVWLCTSGGLVRFREKSESTKTIIPEFQNIQVNGNTFDVQSNPTFSAGENNINFNFISTSYHQGNKVQYRYKIQKEDEWLYTMNRAVNYPKLNNGNYQFEVQAQNEDGYWSNSAIYNFRINPPWWKTWWAMLLSVLFILAFITIYFRGQRKKLKKETAIQQQILDLERSALQAQMNPHFIFNCLNSIQNFILKNDTDNAVRYLSKFAEFIRQVLNTSISSNISLSEEVSMMKNYLELEKMRLKEKLNFTISVDETLDVEMIYLPPLLIQPYVENAIKHGIGNKESNGKVHIHYKKNKDFLKVIVQDNGPGVKSQSGQQNHHDYKSVGMSITQKRLKTLTQSKNNSNIKIGALKKDSSGTEVIVKIKLDMNKVNQ